MFHVRALLREEFLEEHFLFGADSTEGDFACVVTQRAHCSRQVREHTVRKMTTHLLITVIGNSSISAVWLRKGPNFRPADRTILAPRICGDSPHIPTLGSKEWIFSWSRAEDERVTQENKTYIAETFTALRHLLQLPPRSCHFMVEIVIHKEPKIRHCEYL